MTSRSTSPSEGEIIESDSEKATKSLPSVNGNPIDRHSRKRRPTVSRSPSPARSPRVRDYRSRSRSPYRDPRGSKRAREDDHYSDRYERNSRRDPRSFRVHYEDHRYDRSGRHNSSHRDRDRDRDRRHSPSYDQSTHSRPREKRLRTVSRSPPRFSDRKVGGDTPSKGNSRAERVKHGLEAKSRNGRDSREQSVSERGSTPGAAASSRTETEQNENQTPKSVSFKLKKSDLDNAAAQSASDVSTSDVPNADTTPLTEAELIEQRRKRREAIKAKHKGQGSQSTPLLVQVLDPSKSAATPDVQSDAPESPSEGVESLRISPEATPRERSGSDSPSDFDIPQDTDIANSSAQANGEFEDGLLAGDYDPTADMQEDRRREDERQHAHEIPAEVYDETKINDQDVLIPEQKQPPKKGKEFDMFADEDDDDMFAETLGAAKAAGDQDVTKAVPVLRAAIDMSMLDDWDDEEGYYKINIGQVRRPPFTNELLDNRYHVQMNLGKGMFSAVVRAVDLITQKLVAIKIIRSNETMRKAATKEINILNSLKAADPEDKKHIVRFERQFDHKGHLCMVFENLSINLREVLKKFGHGIGISLKAVRAYAQQMFLALSLLRKVNVLHADLKPDNMLVNESRNMLKVCDLGSASDASENEITPYLVSRFYRAPEIILGVPGDYAMDMWSVGCTLFELYTGKILFTGRNNNQMLKSIMETRGKFSHKTLRKAQFASLHFDDLLNFKSIEKDKLTGKEVLKLVAFSKPTRDLRTRLMGSGGAAGKNSLGENESKDLASFVDLLDRCLALNPERRCTPTEALKHPFFMKGK